MVTRNVNLLLMLEMFPDAIIVIDDERTIITCNTIAEQLFGYESGELINQSLNQLISPKLRKIHDQHFEDFRHAKEKRLMDNRPVIFGVNKKGENIPLSIAISFIGDDDEACYMAVIRDAQSVYQKIEKTNESSGTDTLTQLYNRRFLSTYSSCIKDDYTYGLLFLDLNKFKPINDTFGHEVGDQVLCIVSKRIRHIIRECDICARYGGDEFVVILNGMTDPAMLEFVAKKLHASINKRFNVKGIIGQVGVSIGGIIGTHPYNDLEAMIKKADMSMYQAKQDKIPLKIHDDSYKKILKTADNS